MFTRIHNVAWWHWRGHSRRPSHRSQSVSIRRRSVLCIASSQVWVYSQISWPIPHPVIRCSVVSCVPHREQTSVYTKWILRRLECVGRMSWTTIYLDDLTFSDVLVLWRLLHTQTNQFLAGAILRVRPVVCIQLCTPFARFSIPVS
jgi:hypothetical protein